MTWQFHVITWKSSHEKVKLSRYFMIDVTTWYWAPLCLYICKGQKMLLSCKTVCSFSRSHNLWNTSLLALPWSALCAVLFWVLLWAVGAHCTVLTTQLSPSQTAYTLVWPSFILQSLHPLMKPLGCEWNNNRLWCNDERRALFLFGSSLRRAGSHRGLHGRARLFFKNQRCSFALRNWGRMKKKSVGLRVGLRQHGATLRATVCRALTE